MAQIAVRPRRKRGPLISSFIMHKELWLLCIPIIAWALIFCYYPMYGLLMAFFNYIPGKSIFACQFVGLKYFTSFVGKPQFWVLMRNTLAMSALSLTIGFVVPIVFSLMLSEIGALRAKRFIQTVSYLPYFISWVVAGSLITLLLSSDGILNSLMLRLGLISKSIPYLTTGRYYWTIYTIANIWKGLGWSAIIYLSAIAGADEELYQAGAIDGLGRMGMVIHITIPSIMTTIILLWIMGIGGILNAGFDYHLIVGNGSTQAYWDVIDTYVYRNGIVQGFYSPATAVGLMKSLIGLALVVGSNVVSRKVFDVALF